MTDMSFPALDEADEFGGLDHLVPPGQDPELLRSIYAAFTTDMQPENFIERMWVRDMAIQAARLEYVRLAYCAAQRLVQETDPPADDGKEGEDDKEQQRSDRALGKVFVEKLALFGSLNDLEHLVMRERDRLISQYDTRTGIVRLYRDALIRLRELDPDYVDA